MFFCSFSIKHVSMSDNIYYLQGNQYRPTKIPLTSVRPFEYTEVKFIFLICYGGDFFAYIFSKCRLF